MQKQATRGLDVINDGDQGRVDYTVYIKDRLTGFEGENVPPVGTGTEEFPELAAILRQFASPFQRRPTCTGPITWYIMGMRGYELENQRGGHNA